MRKIRKRLWKEWDTHTQRVLRGLTFREESGMKDTLHSESVTYVMFDGSLIVGWGKYDERDRDGMFYVRRSHRRQGVGSSLYKYMRRDVGRMEVYPDPENEAFFDSVGA